MTQSVKKPFYKKVWFWAIIGVIVIGGALGNNEDEEATTAAVEPSPTAVATEAPKETETPKETVASPTEAPVAVSSDWQSEVDSIAAGDGSKTEKFDAVTVLAKNYQLTQDEAFEFTQFMLGEVSNDTYLSDPENDVYMLSSIFKATAVEHLINDSEGLPLDAFAFDFLQNVKYVYRGVETAESESVKSNEAQMAKAIIEIQKSIQ
jgi:hypothetical protein